MISVCLIGFSASQAKLVFWDDLAEFYLDSLDSITFTIVEFG